MSLLMSAPRFRRAVAIVAVAASVMLFAAACQRDYGFKTTAVYRMTDERCTIRIETQGLVRAGADLSRDAEGQLILQRTGAPPIHLSTVLENGETTIDAARGSLLAGAGCTPTPDERAEVLRALEGALSGPKGTLMDGQSKTLRVVSVRFER